MQKEELLHNMKNKSKQMIVYDDDLQILRSFQKVMQKSDQNIVQKVKEYKR